MHGGESMSSIKLKHASGNSMSIEAPATNPASDLALKLPATVGTAGQVLRNSSTAGTLEFGSPALTNVDRWRITANATGTTIGDPISSNWERVDNTNPSQGMPIGTGMSESSGIFTFPSTGIWWVFFNADFQVYNTNVRWVEGVIKTTHDNGSNWDNRAFAYGNLYDSGNNTWGSLQVNTTVDVTNTSNVKVAMKLTSAWSMSMYGSSNDDNSGAMFIRLGDT